MALFRPYEQGKRESKDAGRPASTGATAVSSTTAAGDAGTSTGADAGTTASRGRSRRGGGSTAYRPADHAGTSTTTDVAADTATSDRAASGAPASTGTSARTATRTKVERTRTSGAPRTKQGPTRSRKEAEAERMARLHPTLTKKELREQNRAQGRENRVSRMDALENSPGRVLARDYVDSRWTLMEFLIPAWILMLVMMMLGTFLGPSVVYGLEVFVFIVFGAAFLNMFFLWRGFKRELAARHPGTPTRGLLNYMINRSMWIRRFRRPGPRLNRGDSY